MAPNMIRIAPHETGNQLELSLKQAFELLEPKLRPPFPLTIPQKEEYVQLNQAILYGILCEPNHSKAHIKYLHAIVIDGYELFLGLLVKVVDGLYSKLVDSAKNQLVWVTMEMISVSAIGIDGLLVCLLRQIVGSDFSDGNLWLCFELVNLFLCKWDCFLEEEPLVLTSALYVYLRLLADHCRLSSDVKLEELKFLEIKYCIRMLREQFHLCLRIGRDLARLLQDLVHVPEFKEIWKDLVLNPGAFKDPEFSDISQLYRTRTSSRYFLLRITPEMESQLQFLLSCVKFGNQKRYQTWFTKKFLLGPGTEAAVVDIVRFICCAHHPSNEIIQSDIIPRWAVIGWLLKCCTKVHTEADVKLALFYDWLFFDEKVDNIMNIEPAMLLMVCSTHKYMDLTHSLLEYLLLLVDNYDVDRRSIIARGVSSALGTLVQKGVVHSLDVLTCCNGISPFLQEWLQKFLLDFSTGAPNDLQPSGLPARPMQPASFPDVSCLATSCPLSKDKTTFDQGDGLSTRTSSSSVPI